MGSSIGGCFVADPPKIWEKIDGFAVAAAADRSFNAGKDCAKEEEVFKPLLKMFRLLIFFFCSSFSFLFLGDDDDPSSSSSF
jgi:hypothetical protein